MVWTGDLRKLHQFASGVCCEGGVTLFGMQRCFRMNTTSLKIWFIRNEEKRMCSLI